MIVVVSMYLLNNQDDKNDGDDDVDVDYNSKEISFWSKRYRDRLFEDRPRRW